MLEVYNQLVSSYYSNFKTNPASGSKDSKNIYKSILSINKKSPLYKLSMTNEKQEFAMNIKSAALTLKDQLDYITEPENSVFSSYKVISNDTETASVKVLSDDQKAMPEQISLKVNRLASPQINESYEVPSSDISNLSGTYAFIVNTEDMMYEYQLSITPGSTNESILTKMSDFINKSKIGIKADVIDGGGSTKLNLVSEATGSMGMPIFTLKDFDKSGQNNIGIISYYGLDNITKHSQNSSVEINGETKETLRNQFTFNKALNVTIHKTNSEPVLIQTVPDTEHVYNKVKPMLEVFNSLVDLAAASKQNARSLKLTHDLNLAVIKNYEALEEAGVTSLPDSHLELNKEKLDSSVNNGTLKNIFSSDSSFYHNLINAANNISINPVDYLDKVVVTYPNTSVPGFYSPYAASLYSGMLFNSFC